MDPTSQAYTEPMTYRPDRIKPGCNQNRKSTMKT